MLLAAVVRNTGLDGRPSVPWLTLKVVLVPDGLHGERVDAAIARMLGLSRTGRGLIGTGLVGWTGPPSVKSDRVRFGAMLEVELEDRPVAGVVPQEVVGSDRPRRRRTSSWSTSRSAWPPSEPQGWDGPDVLGHLAGAGFRISTSACPSGEGIVQRLDVGPPA